MKTSVTRIALLLLTSSMVYGAEIVPGNLISGLASDEFEKRESAQAELFEWSKKRKQTVAPALFILSQKNDDPEVRKRSLEVLRLLAEEDYLSEGQGYIGILMQEELLEAGADGKGQAGIRVLDVMKGSPAEQADLKRGDLIISLNGVGWEGIGAVTLFGETIAAKKPRAVVKLTVMRNAPDPIAITVKLGKRPVPDLRMAGGDLGLLEQQAKEQHFKDWLRKQQAE